MARKDILDKINLNEISHITFKGFGKNDDPIITVKDMNPDDLLYIINGFRGEKKK